MMHHAEKSCTAVMEWFTRHYFGISLFIITML
jgi:hypothetical protein